MCYPKPTSLYGNYGCRLPSPVLGLRLKIALHVNSLVDIMSSQGNNNQRHHPGSCMHRKKTLQIQGLAFTSLEDDDRLLGSQPRSGPSQYWNQRSVKLKAWGTEGSVSSANPMSANGVQDRQWQVVDKPNLLRSLEERNVGREQQYRSSSGCRPRSSHFPPFITCHCPWLRFLLPSISHPYINPSNLGQFHYIVCANFLFRATWRQVSTASWMAQKPAEQLRHMNSLLLESAFCETVLALKCRRPKLRSRCFCKKCERWESERRMHSWRRSTRQGTGVGS